MAHTIWMYGETDGDSGYYSLAGFTSRDDAEKYKREKKDAYGTVFPLVVNEHVISQKRQRELWRAEGRCVDCGGECRFKPYTKTRFARCKYHLWEQAERTKKYLDRKKKKKRRTNDHQEARR